MTTSSTTPVLYPDNFAKYRVVVASIAEASGTVTREVSPRRHRITLISARPMPPVAIGERVDGLKLGMGDRGLRDDRQVGAVCERDQVCTAASWESASSLALPPA